MKSRGDFSNVVVTEASGQGGCPLGAVKTDHALLQSRHSAAGESSQPVEVGFRKWETFCILLAGVLRGFSQGGIYC